MKVSELVELLQAMPQDADIWTFSAYRKGHQPFNSTPTVETLCVNPRGNPVFESDKQYMRNADKWEPTQTVVSL